MQKQPTHKSVEGFTLIELVIAVAVIGILTSVAVLGYNQYKVRAYDAHSKQALRDILLQCNAFWLDHDASQVCTHATVAEVYVASDEIVLKFPAEDLPDLPGGSQENFCASAQHVSSPNPYSIDSASVMSEGGDCGGAGGSVQTASAGGSVKTASVSPEQTFETYNNTIAVDVCNDSKNPLGLHAFAMVRPDGTIPRTLKEMREYGWRDEKGDHGQLGTETGAMQGRWKPYLFETCDEMDRKLKNEWKDTPLRAVYIEGEGGNRSNCIVTGGAPCAYEMWWEYLKEDQANGNLRYNFETDTWSNDQGDKFKNGERVE